MSQPLDFNDIVTLINSSIVENTNQDISATDVKDALLRVLEYSDGHIVPKERIDPDIARTTDVNNYTDTAVNNLEDTLMGPGPIPAGSDTLTGLYNLIQAISNPTPVPSIPSGLISMWSGDGTVLPPGWELCDGNNGTPDLSGRFIVGFQSGVSDYDQPGNLSVLKFNGTTGTEIPGNSDGLAANTLTKSNIPQHHHAAFGDGADIAITNSGSHNHFSSTAPIAQKTFGYVPGGLQISVNDYVTTSPPVSSTVHDHPKDDFSGQVGNGATDGLPANPNAIDNRPPYYVLAYIMKM